MISKEREDARDGIRVASKRSDQRYSEEEELIKLTLTNRCRP